MVIVYIETNLLIGLTLGQEPEAVLLLAEADRKGGLQLAIPSICFMEAAATIKSRVLEWEGLRQRFVAEMTQLERNQTSEVAVRLLDRLDGARLVSREYIEGIMSDVRTVIRRVGSVARMIPMTKTTLRKGFSSIIVEAKHRDLILPDNLIIHCILSDARGHRGASKAFLSGNSSEFSRPTVQTALKAAGIDKYFTDAKNALGWYRSQSAH